MDVTNGTYSMMEESTLRADVDDHQGLLAQPLLLSLRQILSSRVLETQLWDM